MEKPMSANRLSQALDIFNHHAARCEQKHGPSGGCRVCAVPAVIEALAAGRIEGKREGMELAAEIVDAHTKLVATAEGASGLRPVVAHAAKIAAAIRKAREALNKPEGNRPERR